MHFLAPLIALAATALAAPLDPEAAKIPFFQTDFYRERIDFDKQFLYRCNQQTTTVDNSTGKPVTTVSPMTNTMNFNLEVPAITRSVLYRGVNKTSPIHFALYKPKDAPLIPDPVNKPAWFYNFVGFSSVQFGARAGAKMWTAAAMNANTAGLGSLSDGALKHENGTRVQYNGQDILTYNISMLQHIPTSTEAGPEGGSPVQLPWAEQATGVVRRSWPTYNGVMMGTKPAERYMPTVAIVVLAFSAVKPNTSTYKQFQETLIDKFGEHAISGFAMLGGRSENDYIAKDGNTTSITCATPLFVDYDVNFDVWPPVVASIFFVAATACLVVFKCILKKPLFRQYAVIPGQRKAAEAQQGGPTPGSPASAPPPTEANR